MKEDKLLPGSHRSGRPNTGPIFEAIIIIIINAYCVTFICVCCKLTSILNIIINKKEEEKILMRRTNPMPATFNCF